MKILKVNIKKRFLFDSKLESKRKRRKNVVNKLENIATDYGLSLNNLKNIIEKMA